MTKQNVLDNYAAVGQVAAALGKWRQRDKANVGKALEGMPVAVLVVASMTLLEAAFSTLSQVTRKPFEEIVEAVVVEVIGVGLASDVEEGKGHE